MEKVERVEKVESVKRNPSIELLRCLAMGLIVGYHCFAYGEFSGSHAAWTAMFTTLICWHVDTFLAISGWFGIKFSWMKVAKLGGLILFYNALDWAFGGRSVGGGWFGNNYLLLMLLAPLLNWALEKMSARQTWTVWSIFAAGMVAWWLPWHEKDPMWWVMGGYSIVNFVFIYFTVRGLRRLRGGEGVALPWVGVGVFGGMFALFAGIDLVSRLTGHGHLSGIGAVFSSYDAPHVWIFAICLVAFFVQRVRIPEWLGKVATFCAPSMFGIYLLHDTTSFGHEIFRIPERWLAAHTALHPAIIVILAAVWTFVFCLAVDLVRREVLRRLRGLRRKAKGQGEGEQRCW